MRVHLRRTFRLMAARNDGFRGTRTGATDHSVLAVSAARRAVEPLPFSEALAAAGIGGVELQFTYEGVGLRAPTPTGFQVSICAGFTTRGRAMTYP
jgi:hypothetical protein